LIDCFEKANAQQNMDEAWLCIERFMAEMQGRDPIAKAHTS